ncbi:hypothetical protein CDL15_Pgr004156 [Punica granatum]|uniref:Uncharacterized protein n=2 Tax=Punica granatum TaxID=22663 RepID=A0A218XG79_PUNGR|nr:hypothetical protein CDL15_Pgr004156 [Punica granatum]
MASSLISPRLSRSPTVCSLLFSFKLKVRSSSKFSASRLAFTSPHLAKALSTSTAPNEYYDQTNPSQWTPQSPSSQWNPQQTQRPGNNQYNYSGGSNQGYPTRGYPNQAPSYPGRGYPNQGQNYPNPGQGQGPGLGQGQGRAQGYPQQTTQWNANTPNQSTNRWNNQNQGSPQSRIPNQWPQQNQNSNQWGSQQASQAPQTPAAPVRSIIDLKQLCDEGKLKEAIELMTEGVKADAECFSQLFALCNNPKHLENAKKVHDYFLQSTCRSDLHLNNRVLEMYGKCGSMTDARRVFNHMLDKNIDSWHLMINGYANNGLGDDGLELYEQMTELGLRPNEQTFLAVLSSCACIGAIEEGFLHFDSMKNEYGIEPGIEHYLGLIDVLGQPGHLAELLDYIEKKLPFEPTVEVWDAVRNLARIHGDIDLEDYAEEIILALDPSRVVANKIPTPPQRRMMAINMLEGRNQISEFKNPTFYKDDEKRDRKASKETCKVGTWLHNRSLAQND